jgi:hypothetical protein
MCRSRRLVGVHPRKLYITDCIDRKARGLHTNPRAFSLWVGSSAARISVSKTEDVGSIPTRPALTARWPDGRASHFQIQGDPLRDSSIGGARGSEPRGSRFESWSRSLTEAWPSLDYGTGLENQRAWAPEVQILSLPPGGGRSSMAERAVVARVVVGSIPTVHS